MDADLRRFLEAWAQLDRSFTSALICVNLWTEPRMFTVFVTCSPTQLFIFSLCLPMGSTSRIMIYEAGQEPASTMRWRSWPLVDRPRWSWLVVFGMLAAGGLVWYLGGGWLLAVAAVGGLAGTLRQFLLPAGFELDTLGVRR